jgi:hypothetical protein
MVASCSKQSPNDQSPPSAVHHVKPSANAHARPRRPPPVTRCLRPGVHGNLSDATSLDQALGAGSDVLGRPKALSWYRYSTSHRFGALSGVILKRTSVTLPSQPPASPPNGRVSHVTAGKLLHDAAFQHDQCDMTGGIRQRCRTQPEAGPSKVGECRLELTPGARSRPVSGRC